MSLCVCVYVQRSQVRLIGLPITISHFLLAELRSFYAVGWLFLLLLLLPLLMVMVMLFFFSFFIWLLSFSISISSNCWFRSLFFFCCCMFYMCRLIFYFFWVSSSLLNHSLSHLLCFFLLHSGYAWEAMEGHGQNEAKQRNQIVTFPYWNLFLCRRSFSFHFVLLPTMKTSLKVAK